VLCGGVIRAMFGVARDCEKVTMWPVNERPQDVVIPDILQSSET
jgi:hypothetical protein